MVPRTWPSPSPELAPTSPIPREQNSPLSHCHTDLHPSWGHLGCHHFQVSLTMSVGAMARGGMGGTLDPGRRSKATHCLAMTSLDFLSASSERSNLVLTNISNMTAPLRVKGYVLTDVADKVEPQIAGGPEETNNSSAQRPSEPKARKPGLWPC